MSNLFSSGGAGNVGGEFDIGQSLKFNDDESQYLSWTPASAGNRKTWTWSGWVKRGNLVNTRLFNAGASSASKTEMTLYGSGALWFEGKGSNTCSFQTAALFRDVSAWYHFVVAVDTTQSTSSDRVKLYVNGERITAFDTYETYPAQNSDFVINSTTEHTLGKRSYSTDYSDMYLADVYFIDGTALDPTSFGESVDGYWKPKEATGLTYGTNGFHLTFQDDVVSEGFNTVTYRGNGGTQSISGLGFEPDLVWYKRRNSAASHQIYDLIRGVGNTMFTNATSAESFDANVLRSFDSDGFTIGSEAGSNSSGDNFVAWAWDAGTGSAASNTDGDITSTVKANTSYGFSIVSFNAGAAGNHTAGHGLSSAPELIIMKDRDSVGYGNWSVFHADVCTSTSNYLLLNGTGALGSVSNTWGAALPTSTVFGFGSNVNIGANDDIIAYCFHSVSGYSSIGSYSGTGAAGKQVTGLGFKPAWLMIKSTSLAGTNWAIWDNTRSTTDPRDDALVANGADAEFVNNSSFSVDFLSDGFELNSNYGDVNQSGETYIYMAFADTREYAFWKDVSGNGNHWTPNNLDYRDSLPDTPTNNFAVLNPLDINSSGGMTLSEGNLKLSSTNAGSAYCSFSNIVLESGGWYSEVYINGQTGGYPNVGIGDLSKSPTANEGIFAVKGVGYAADGNVYRDGGTIIDTVSSFTTGDVIGIAYDADNQKIYFSKNGTWQNSADPAAGTNGYTVNDPIEGYVFGASIYSPSPVTFSFGQDSTFAGAMAMGSYTDDNGIGNFQYAPPSGYLSLCTSNLDTPTIVDGSQHFTTMLHTGTGSQQAVTGAGFAPDFRWTKSRGTAYSHILHDNVRGETAYLQSNNTNAENTLANMSLDSDGFTVHADDLGDPQVSWLWKAGGTAVSNTNGSITSQVSANTDMGFSIVSYTGNGTAGATVGHGLSSAPEMIIQKSRDEGTTAYTAYWPVYHKDLSSTDYHLRLNDTVAQTLKASQYNSTAPTSSVFSLGTAASGNYSGDNFIAYCFHSSDVIKVGSYTGNGSSDGPFVYTGFRPAWVMIKNVDNARNWHIKDTERDPYNFMERYLNANDSSSEGSGVSSVYVDYLSNGFKLRGTSTTINESGSNHIYLAIAETPLKYATAR